MRRLAWFGGLVGLLAACSSSESDAKRVGASDAAASTPAVTPVLGADIVLGANNVASVEELASGNLLVIDTEGGVRELDPNLKPIAFTTAPALADSTAYLVDDGASILYVSGTQLSKVSAVTGAPDEGFGKGGTLYIPRDPGTDTDFIDPSFMSGQGDDGTVALVLSEITGDDPIASPYNVAIATVGPTGALTKKTPLITLPSTNSTDSTTIDAVVPLRVGSFALIVSQQHALSPGSLVGATQQFSVIRTTDAQVLPPVAIDGGSGDHEGLALLSARELADGALGLVFRNLDFSTPNDIHGQIYEAKLAAGASTATLHAIGDSSSIGIGDNFDCGPFVAATPNQLWTTHSTIVNAQATNIELAEATESGASPHITTLALLNRCAHGIFALPSGLLLLDSVEVSETNPIAHLTRIDPHD